MTSASAKTFVGGVGTYPVLNQGGAPLTISGTNTFDNITNTFSGSTITFPTSTTTTFNNFSLYGSSTGGGAATGYPLGSVSFNGSTQYLNTTANIIPASTNFTIECWVYPTSFAAIIEVFSQYTAAITGRLDLSVTATTGLPTFFIGDTVNLQITSSVALSLNTWSHLAVTRSGNNYVLYLNGVSVATGSATTAIQQKRLVIGALDSSPISRYFSGYISNLRVVTGVVVYTGNFTVPTDPLTTTQSAGTNINAITGTQTTLLLNTPNSASFITDSSVNNYATTNNGVATANSLSPFLMYINSTTSGTSATITKSSGVVYGNSLSIKDSNATGGATWYAGPTSLNVSNNTGWIFNQLPIINMSNISISGGVTFSNDPI
jgi:hypothetical protein